MAEQELDDTYRKVLDGVVNLQIDVYDRRPYDMIGRRIEFSEDYRPVDVMLADFTTGDIRIKYIDTQDEASELRRKARDEFAEILEGTEWDPIPSAIRESSNSDNVYGARLRGNIYAPNSSESVDEFLRRFTEFELSEFTDIEVLEQ